MPFSNNDPNAPSFNTDFTLDLSEPLTNVISLKLYSVQIPTTWYTFDTTLGNTCFEYDETVYVGEFDIGPDGVADARCAAGFG